MNIELKENQSKINRLVEDFITTNELIKAVYEQSRQGEKSVQTKAYILTNQKILYVEVSQKDAFLKCYPLNKGITYQIERQMEPNLLNPNNIINIKLRVSADASIIFRFDSQPDQSSYITSLTEEKKAAYGFLLKLNSLLAKM